MVEPVVKRFGLFGWPVKHSVSPAMQGAGFDAIGMNATYELFEVPPEGLADAVQRLRDEAYAGWNITVPHKNAMIDLVDVVDPTALTIGSINTVVNRDGTLHAYSTDGYGLEMSVKRAFNLPVNGRHFMFWGCGGAARATACHFAAEGAAGIVLVNRTVSKAEALGSLIASINPECQITIHEPSSADLIDTVAGIDVLIQSTSIGLHAGDPLSIPEKLLIPNLNIVDMIYRPTRLSEIASRHGCAFTDGRDMLLYQGVRSFEIWTGQDAPVEAMGSALDRALGR